MKQRRHTPEQVIRKLAEGEKLLAEGKTIEEVSRYLEISDHERLLRMQNERLLRMQRSKLLRMQQRLLATSEAARRQEWCKDRRLPRLPMWKRKPPQRPQLQQPPSPNADLMRQSPSWKVSRTPPF
jgi:hypothetical protein